MTQPRTIVHEHLALVARARRRRRVQVHAASTVAALAGLIALAVVVLSLAAELRPWMLVAIGSLTLTGLGMIVVAAVRRTSPSVTAAWLARRTPGIGGAVADAVEFDDRLVSGAGIVTGSPDLAEAHVGHAAQLVTAEDPRAAVDRLPPPPWRTALALAAVAALALAAFPSGRAVLLHGRALAAPARVSYGAVEVALRFPAHLKLADRTETGTGDIEAPVGTHATISVRADRPLAVARIEPSEGTPVEMTVTGDVARGTLVIARSGTYRLILRGSGGEMDPSPPVHVLRAVGDEPPSVRLIAPRRDVVIGESETFDLTWLAEDDHGVAAVALVASREDAPPGDPAPAGEPRGDGGQADGERTPLGTFDPPVRSREGSSRLGAADLGLVAGESAWFWVEARDDDQVTGPKWAASTRVRVTVRSVEDEAEELDSGREQLAEHLLTVLAGHLVSGPERLKTVPDVAAVHATITAGLSTAVVMAGDVVATMQRRMDDPQAASALQDLRARLESLARTRARRSEELSSSDAVTAIGTHAALHPREIEELERDVLFFDMWADRRASLRASDAAERLLAAAAELREASAREPAATAAELKAAADEYARAAESLDALLAELARAAGADPAIAARAAQTLSQARRGAAGLQERLAQGDRTTAERAASRLQESAEELAALVGELAAAGAQGDPGLVREIQRAEAELRRLGREQRDLRDQTNRVRDEMAQAMSPEDRQRAEQAFADLLRLAREAVEAHDRGETILGASRDVVRFFNALDERERLRQQIAELGNSRGGMTPETMRQMADLQVRHGELIRGETDAAIRIESLMRGAQGAREMLGRLAQVIADKDLANARRPARWALGLLEGLRARLAEGPSDGDAGADAAFQTAQARAAEILERLDELEKQIERASQSAMTSAQRARLQAAAGSQADLQARARGLAGRLRELGADAPFLREGVAESVDEAGGHMDEASRNLFGREPGPASENQGEAMASLQEAADALSPGRDRDDGAARGGGRRAGGNRPGQAPGTSQAGASEGRDGRMGRSSRDRVEIPDADAYKVPREFREEILEAMRETSAPDGYADAVREYYRRLVE